MFGKILVLIICIVGIIYIILLKSKYQNDASFTKENINLLYENLPFDK